MHFVIPAKVIARKRDGHALSADEIAKFVDGYSQGAIPDYQMAAFAMAVCIRGMNLTETTVLTERMLKSGDRLQWSPGAPKVDKHSTGGLGDKVSLVLAPLLASCGLQVPMVSGRGLGITGGTLDKLQAIPGFRTNLTIDQIRSQVEAVGCVICGATTEIAPADRKLYGLRDVTATVPSVPLITASILSKKLAESIDSLVLDVKFGSGTFMEDPTAARALAESLVQVAERLGVRTTALLSNMNQPLGYSIGHSLEVREAINALQGVGPEDLRILVLALGAELICRHDPSLDADQAKQKMDEKLKDGSAYEKFSEMVSAQGGDLSRDLPVCSSTQVLATRAGWLADVDGDGLGHAMIEIGGGRRLMDDVIDHAAGIELFVKTGEWIDKDQPIALVHAAPGKAATITSQVREAFIIVEDEPSEFRLIADRVSIEDVG